MLITTKTPRCNSHTLRCFVLQQDPKSPPGVATLLCDPQLWPSCVKEVVVGGRLMIIFPRWLLIHLKIDDLVTVSAVLFFFCPSNSREPKKKKRKKKDFQVSMLCNKQEARASVRFWWFDNLEQKNTTASRCCGYSCKMGYFEMCGERKQLFFPLDSIYCICNEHKYDSEHSINLCVKIIKIKCTFWGKLISQEQHDGKY